jgi:cell division protein FtsQ
MASDNKYTFKKILGIAVWVLLGSGIILLLAAAVTKNNNEEIKGMEINITGVQNNYFVDKKDVIKILEKVNGRSFKNASPNNLDLTKMETVLQKDQWIKKAEIFYDNNNVLQVKITEREPVVRIFTTSGASFYMDSSLKRLPLSDKFSARLPVFTNFPTDVIVLKKGDSVLLKNIKTLSEFIGDNSFWMAQIDQVDITPANTFELIPKLGNQVIRFGDINNYEQKFNKLLAFYKQVQTKTGWNRYSIIDLQFKNQVVAVNRDAKEIKMDSLRAVEIMKNIIAETQKRLEDSTNIQLVQPSDANNINRSVEKDDLPEEIIINNKSNVDNNKASSVIPVQVPEKPVKKNPKIMGSPSVLRSSSNEKPRPARSKKGEVKKPVIKKEVLKNPEDKPVQAPKAVMPAQTDY